MKGTRRLLFVVGCLVCLLVVATALPAADPRVPAPGGTDGPTAGQWESIDGAFDFTTDLDEEGEPQNDDENDGDDGGTVNPDIEITGALEPGNEVRIEIEDAGGIHPFNDNEESVAINGERRGETEEGTLDVTVPYAAEMNVSVVDDDRSRTFDVETNATIDPLEGAAPTNDLELSASVGSTALPNATVFLEDEPVAETDAKGNATVTLPDEAGPVELAVEREPVSGTHTVDVPEPEVGFTSPLLFPGFPAAVQVSADGTGVEGATVSVDGDTATTGDDGRTRLWLPIAEEATVTATAGEETATATVGNLYLRLGAMAVIVPGFVIGGIKTYARLVAIQERRGGTTPDGLFVAFADSLAGFSSVLAGLPGALASASIGLSGVFDAIRRIRLPRPTLSPSGGGWSLPSFGAAFSSFGKAFGSLSVFTSLGHIGRGSSGGDDDSRFGGQRDNDRHDGPNDGNEPPALAAEPLTPRGPRAEIRVAWHAFLDRLDLEDRETLTPGQASRLARVVGYPTDRVATLVAIVRDVEYGGREASSERAATAREIAAELIDHEPDEEGST
ncbi:DUF4129 domain-containing protein [Halopiger goleimassiliensis]|uniref:DUF4129 domain-containing protein n=1 Tax=Halopiger goleimassiliensis TaxID=1293048 RepID=UPI000677D9A5|nr:DUF4129 domain-containing protein [Halopiger goleimassiliensis]